MCRDGKFRCLTLFNQLYEAGWIDPASTELLVQKYPCLLDCSEMEALTNALETILTLEEISLIHKVMKH